MSDAVALKVKIITGARDGPDLLVIGGVHGDEFESMAAIRRLIAAVDPLQLRGRLICIPVVNEPAYWRGQRTAEDELDLARTCPGRPDGSITERVAHAVSAHIRASNYLIDLHSGGLVMEFYPTVGYTLHPDPKILKAQRHMARALNMPIIWGTYPHLDGRTLSVARDAKVPAIYAEWMGGGICDPAGVDAYYEGCLNVMAALDMLDREQPVSRSEHVVEDNRNNAGFVQLNYPAPFAGYFEPLVTLKARIAPGDPIGAVVAPLGDRRETVVSTQSGLVLCLRVYSRVHAGDSLATILEFEI